MLRNSLLGALSFGLVAAAAGYVWVAFEFPFAIALPAFVGWYVVTRTRYPGRTSLMTGLVGGVSFTVAFMVGLFFALTDGSPVALTAWMTATLAAAVAGALTGWVLGHARGAGTMALYAGVGMLVATVVAGLMREIAPAGVDVEGLAQSAYFAAVQGIVGAIVGAAIGAGVHRLSQHSDVVEPLTPMGGRPHAA